MKTTVSCQCPKDIKERYNFLYPYTLSRFILQCIKLAIADKNFFDSVYFTNCNKE